MSVEVNQARKYIVSRGIDYFVYFVVMALWCGDDLAVANKHIGLAIDTLGGINHMTIPDQKVVFHD